MIFHSKLKNGISTAYLGKTIYINIENEFNRSMINEIDKFIASQTKNKWFKYIILKSWIILDKNNKYRKFIQKICEKYNSKCIIKNATCIDKIGTLSIELLNCGNIKIPPYSKVGYCKIQVA